MNFAKIGFVAIRSMKQRGRAPAALEPWKRRKRDRLGALAALRVMLRIAGCGLILVAAGLPFAVRAQTPDPVQDEQMWKALKGCQDIGGTRIYKELNPEGRYAARADECLARDEVKRCEKIEPAIKYIENFPQSPHVDEARKCVARLEARRNLKALVERLLTECRAHHDANRLTEGSGGNALDCYRRVLDKDPGNARALEGITRIEQHYVDKAGSSLERERPDIAQRWIRRLSTINPEHPRIEALNANLRELKRRLAEQERLAAAQEKLRRDVEALLAQGKPEQARSLLAASRGEGLTGKSLKALEKKVEKALAEAEHARSLSRKVAAIRSSIEKGRVGAAREGLAEARALGLDDRTHGELLAAIGKAEAARAAKARAEEVGRLWGECERHISERRPRPALECSQKVAALDPNHSEAAAAMPGLKLAVAFEDASEKDTVKAYFDFERTYGGTKLARVARFLLTRKEKDYWEAVRKAGTRAAYQRYLEIYSAGRYVERARAGLARGE